MDAEHSWYQPAIDGYVTVLSQEYNKLPTATQPAKASGGLWGQLTGASEKNAAKSSGSSDEANTLPLF